MLFFFNNVVEESGALSFREAFKKRSFLINERSSGFNL